MPALELGYKAALALMAAFKGGEKAMDPRSSPTDEIEGGLTMGSGGSGAVGSILGATLPASAGAGTALLGSGIGAGLMAASGVLGAGAFGLALGNRLDRSFGLSDKLSAAMVGDGNDDLLLHGLVGTQHPGLPTEKEETAAAARLPVLEARRQGEIARLVEMWTDDSATRVNPEIAATLLEEKYGIDMGRIHAETERKQEEERQTPAARMEREAARQVRLSHAIQTRDAAPLPMLRPMEDAQIAGILDNYSD